jgi:hypothetical protein
LHEGRLRSVCAPRREEAQEILDYHMKVNLDITAAGHDSRGALPQGPQNGFKDRHGNEWTWDHLHNNHWDVQLPNGGHLNVTPKERF